MNRRLLMYRSSLFRFSDEPPGDRDAKYFKFKMPALIAFLKKLAEQGQAPYYNIDILKYQVNMFCFFFSQLFYTTCTALGRCRFPYSQALLLYNAHAVRI